MPSEIALWPRSSAITRRAGSRSRSFDERTDGAAVARTNGDLERVQRELPALAEAPSLDRQIRRYLVVNAFLVLIWAAAGSDDGFWPVWPILVWGFLLVLRANWRQPRGRALPRGR
jgi:hypothetical protein